MRVRLPFRVRRLILKMLSTLSVKMTLFYGVLFVLTTTLSVLGTRAAVEAYAEDQINHEMMVGSAVFDRIAVMQFGQLRQAGQVLSADFGFRSAAATGDGPTIASALDSLKARMKLDDAFFVSTDGSVTGIDQHIPAKRLARLLDALDAGADEGIARWNKTNHMIVASPVKAPVLIGWVVFSRNMDAAELQSLAALSALDLKPTIVPIGALPDGVQAIAAGVRPAIERQMAGERILVQASPVKSFLSGEPQALFLEYSLTKAMSAYGPILWAGVAFGLIGVMLAIMGSAILAKRLARPIQALDAAARKVSSGEHAQVVVNTRDELGRLARSFNKMVIDIEEREQRISHMALHDGLTGLANRSLLRAHMAQLLKRKDDGHGVVLFCLDLDNFKTVNDTLGHPIGDALLCEVASRLKNCCADAFVARLGGDEFAVVTSDVAAASVTARGILAAFDAQLVVNGHRIVSGTSIGIAVSPQDGADPTVLLKNADLALYRAKHEGKGGFRFFETSMDAEAQVRRAMEIDLHDALSRGELELYFQPLFGLSQNRVTAFEALMRWNHPTRGMVSPLDFIPLAEETGLIVPIGEWAIRESCRIASSWPDHIRVAVNISPVQFRSNTLNRVVLQALASTGLAPERLELEITESLFIDNVESTLASLHSLRALGVRVALDDFGTGYSSLSYLRSFPFDKIKIDRSFIEDLLAHDGATAIIKSITSLAEALGMETTAEGVENIDQLDILREQGCTQIQGYYFSKPIQERDVARLLGKLNGAATQAA